MRFYMNCPFVLKSTLWQLQYFYLQQNLQVMSQRQKEMMTTQHETVLNHPLYIMQDAVFYAKILMQIPDSTPTLPSELS